MRTFIVGRREENSRDLRYAMRYISFLPITSVLANRVISHDSRARIKKIANENYTLPKIVELVKYIFGTLLIRGVIIGRVRTSGKSISVAKRVGNGVLFLALAIASIISLTLDLLASFFILFTNGCLFFQNRQ